MAEFSNDTSLMYMKEIQQQGNRTDAPSWVYYKNLKETHPSFYELVNSRFTSNFGEQGYNDKCAETANKLSVMAAAERNKEIALLNSTFGTNIEVNLSEPASVKNFVKTFQELMEFKGIAERAKQRLFAKEKHISIAPFLNDYFTRALKNDVNDNLDTYVLQLNNGQQSFMSFFKGRLSIILEKAAENLANSNNLKGQDDSGKGYYEFFTELLNRPQMLNQFFQDINKDTNFSSLAEQVYNSLNADRTGKALKEAMTKKEATTTSKFIEGGRVQEILKTYAINLLMQLKVPNVSFSATQVGGQGARPDMIMEVGLNIPTGAIEEEFEKMINASREEARAAAKRIMERLEKADNGFLVYTNMKNYGLDSKTHFKGTENMKLQQYFDLLSDIQSPKKIAQFVTAIMNTLGGAIAEDQKNQISSLIAQDLAYFLFDDYEAIGNQMPVGAQTIHLFVLSDFYVPLSLLLQLLADSFSDIMSDPKKYGDITIYSGDIAYPDGPWGIEQWRTQRAMALNEIELGIRFFRNFTSWIQEQLS